MTSPPTPRAEIDEAYLKEWVEWGITQLLNLLANHTEFERYLRHEGLIAAEESEQL